MTDHEDRLRHDLLAKLTRINQGLDRHDAAIDWEPYDLVDKPVREVQAIVDAQARRLAILTQQ